MPMMTMSVTMILIRQHVATWNKLWLLQKYKLRRTFRDEISISITIFSKFSLLISIFFKFADISTIDLNIWYSINKSGEDTKMGWKQAKMIGFCTHFHRYFIDILSIFLRNFLSISIFSEMPYQYWYLLELSYRFQNRYF